MSFLSVINSKISSFECVTYQQSIIVKIQECVLSHLGLPDMGKLRDKYEGQAYFEKIKKEIIAEFCFEKLTSLEPFNWEKRKKKTYSRLNYNIDGKKVLLVSFGSPDNKFPLLLPGSSDLYIFVYLPNNPKVYISNILSNEDLIKYGNKISNPLYEKHLEFSNFDKIEINLPRI